MSYKFDNQKESKFDAMDLKRQNHERLQSLKRDRTPSDSYEDDEDDDGLDIDQNIPMEDPKQPQSKYYLSEEEGPYSFSNIRDFDIEEDDDNEDDNPGVRRFEPKKHS